MDDDMQQHDPYTIDGYDEGSYSRIQLGKYKKDTCKHYLTVNQVRSDTLVQRKHFFASECFPLKHDSIYF